ncbi:MAG TPA: SOS response-associated peptidase [Bacteroidia bacterium]|nr:SOS response-associated peptidase [Bacteroidia bacterium]
MCGRYVVVQKWEELEKSFHALPINITEPYIANYNVGPGSYAPVVLFENGCNKIVNMQFGLTPFWAKKKMYLFNARAEGDGNENDDTNYTGGKGIIAKPAFRKPIREQRCLVIANAFMEGPKNEKLSKPFLCYLRNRESFCMAGIYDTHKDQTSGEITQSFAIITTVANDLMQKIGHHRSPVILGQNDEMKWLESTNLAEITSMLKPYSASLMNAYPIDAAIKNQKNNAPEFLKPIGDPLFKETEQVMVSEEYYWNKNKRSLRKE